MCFAYNKISRKHTMAMDEEKLYYNLDLDLEDDVDDLPLPELTYQPEKTLHENMYQRRTQTPKSKSRLGRLLRGKYQPWILTICIVVLVVVAAAIVGMAFLHPRRTSPAGEPPNSLSARSIETATAQFDIPQTASTASPAASTATAAAQMPEQSGSSGSLVMAAAPQTSGSLRRCRKWWMHTGLVHGFRKVWKLR